jgi:hypothetical protein
VARARNIKPGFFKNDDLAQCEYGARLMFVGLWCLADREGRLEDRPIRIKGELFPYDNCEVAVWLQQLTELGFITRYEVAGSKFIQVNKFKKHQNPHCKESASTIPAPCSPGANTISAGLIPDSGFLIPDSLILNPESRLQEPEAAIADPLTNPVQKETTRLKFIPPTVDEVREYCSSRKNRVDPEKFVDFYASKGWKVGKEKMIDWQASVRTWEKSNGDNGRGNQSTRVGEGQRFRG